MWPLAKAKQVRKLSENGVKYLRANIKIQASFGDTRKAAH